MGLQTTKSKKYYKQSRDSWKKKNKEKADRIKYYENRVRDLERSKANWKNRAKLSEAKLLELEKKLQLEG